MPPTQGSGGAPRPTNLKPPPIPRAVVVVVENVDAEDVVSASPGAYTALDAVVSDGCSATLVHGTSRELGGVYDTLAGVGNVIVVKEGSLKKANDAVRKAVDADGDALVLCAVAGPGSWDAMHAKPADLGDGFPIPPQSCGGGSAVGVAFWAARSRARVDKRTWMGDVCNKPGEGAVTPLQLAEEVLSKVGAVANFGA